MSLKSIWHFPRKYKTLVFLVPITFWLCNLVYRGENSPVDCAQDVATAEFNMNRTFKQISVRLGHWEHVASDSGLDNRSLLLLYRDFNHANPHPFRYLIFNEDLCKGSRSDVYLLVVVHTHPRNFNRRMFMRKTWANPVLYPYLQMVVLFAMGSANDTSEDFNTAVRVESNRFHDIVQEDFLDSYRNLTYKAIMWLRWSAFYCPQVAYVLKIDDDIFSIFCLNWKNMEVIRDNGSKWYVSKEDYPSDQYLSYCSGSAYLLTADALFPMYKASRRVRFFWVDDVYVTGLLRTYSGVEVKSIASMYTLSCSELMVDLFRKFTLFCHLPANMNQFYELWNSLIKLYNLPQINS
ncbi:unnamed protein product [Soboliphyme baturini]|uniref:Hexosyltransferase n=1 Tax=Soboliphyme baturini TaxID=241478 RepID=A0A183IU71_9BILA|nr:unnamed protein product [Soboliphyme baturini]